VDTGRGPADGKGTRSVNAGGANAVFRGDAILRKLFDVH